MTKELQLSMESRFKILNKYFILGKKLLKITSKVNMKFEYLGDHDAPLGWVDGWDCENIYINKKYLGKRDLRKTVLHELVHIKQQLIGSLKEEFDKEAQFVFTYYKNVNTTFIDYYNQPHEKQAFRMEDYLFNKIQRKYLTNKK